MKNLILSALVAVVSILPLQADTFGTGANQFTLDFTTIGNAGNAADPTTGYGAVPYAYRIGKYAISQNQINAATVNGLQGVTAGAWSGDQPAGNITWYQAAAFVNWLNTNQGYDPAYNLTYSNGSYTMSLWPTNKAWTIGGTNLYRNASCYYFLPSENEWYKAAYGKADGSGYYLYPTGSDSIPTAVASGTAAGTAVYSGYAVRPSAPASVFMAGGLSPYGTIGQGGNIHQWEETAFSGSNTNAIDNRGFRGGCYLAPADNLLSSSRYSCIYGPNFPDPNLGLRVASIDDSWLTNGLVAYYPFNGNANDESGNGNNMQLIGGASLIEMGLGNGKKALQLDGTQNQWAEVADSESLKPKGFSISLWFNNYLENNSDIRFLCGKVEGQMEIHFGVPQNPSNGIRFIPDQYYSMSDYTNNVQSHNWYHLVCISGRGSGGTKIFLNGRVVSTIQSGPTDGSGDLNLQSGPFYLGRRSNNGWAHFNGLISKVRIYNRALSSNEVAALYNYESHPYCDGHWENNEESEAAAWVNYFSSNLPSNSGFYSALAANPNFLSALANAFTSSPSTYGILHQGPQGIQGPIGLTGPKGDTGASGLQGIQGLQGPIGLSGLKGNTGASGLQGIQGIQGPIGAVGPQGPKGDKGDTGAIGPIGLTGLQGIQGPVGVFDPTVLTNTAFLQSLATNPTFLNALSTQIKTGLNNYGLAVKQNQSLNFPVIPPQTLTPTSTVTISVTSSANQTPITYSSGNTAVATVSNNILKLIGSGSTTIIASQAGNNLYNPISVSQPLVVSKGVQTINFPAIPTQTFSPWKTVTLKSTSSANPSANLTNRYIIGNGAIGSISNNVLLLLGTGGTTITATNSGNAYFSPASATQTLIVK